MTEPNWTRTELWADLRYAARFRHSEWFVDFELFAGVAFGNVQGSPMYPAEREDGGADYVTSLDDATRYAWGNVKWDGCANLSFTDQAQNIMLHFCGRDDATALGTVLGRVYDVAREMLGDRWDQ